MDLERSGVIDLMPVRSAESLAHWLSLHPEVEIITRDRSSLYANGGRQGAPAAVQITDRYHLVSNLGEPMERALQQLQIEARRQLGQTATGRPQNAKKPTWIEARRQRRRQARNERYLAVVNLHRQECSSIPGVKPSDPPPGFGDVGETSDASHPCSLNPHPQTPGCCCTPSSPSPAYRHSLRRQHGKVAYPAGPNPSTMVLPERLRKKSYVIHSMSFSDIECIQPLSMAISILS
jgi:hypothetical protein